MVFITAKITVMHKRHIASYELNEPLVCLFCQQKHPVCSVVKNESDREERRLLEPALD